MPRPCPACGGREVRGERCVRCHMPTWSDEWIDPPDEASVPPLLGEIDLEKLIEDVVTRLAGCKGTELVGEVVAAAPGKIEGAQLLAMLESMVLRKKLVEIEYVLPDMPYRAKSFYLPAGATCTISGAGRSG